MNNQNTDTKTEWLEQACRNLAACNPGQISHWGYQRIAESVLCLKDIRPGSSPGLLVFGTGRDTEFWLSVSEAVGGRVVFLESEQNWIDQVKLRKTNSTVVKVEYGAETRGDWLELLDKPRSDLELLLPAFVEGEQWWDVILVDGPAGYSDSTPGRMKSIATAAKLAESNPSGSKVFVHDINRVVEKVYSQLFLAPIASSVRIAGVADRMAEYVILPRNSGNDIAAEPKGIPNSSNS